MKEMIDICVFEKVNENLVYRAVPQNAYYTTNFAIDLSKVDVSDITVDGVIYHSQACPSLFIYISKENGKNCTNAETNSSEIFDLYKLKRQYSNSLSKTLEKHILKRAIVKFEAYSSKLCKYALLNTRAAQKLRITLIVVLFNNHTEILKNESNHT